MADSLAFDDELTLTTPDGAVIIRQAGSLARLAKTTVAHLEERIMRAVREGKITPNGELLGFDIRPEFVADLAAAGNRDAIQAKVKEAQCKQRMNGLGMVWK